MEDRKVSKEEEAEAAVKPTRSFRYEDYSTRRVFLRSYPLQWDSPAPGADEKPGHVYAAAGEADDDPYEQHRDRRWVVAVVEWGEDKLLLLRRVKKRLALYLLGCHYTGGRPALKYKSGGSSCATAMLKSI
uniref:Uncharacterized protein n=1 Tax=Avena sativa TaxID=4498 RepID=A0ACD6AEG5_AVESA